jgi:hypothetical protein
MKNYYFACYFLWVQKLVFDFNVGTQEHRAQFAEGKTSI